MRDSLMRRPAFSKLDKHGQELVVAFAENIGKGSGPRATSDILKAAGRAQLQKDAVATDRHTDTELTNLSIGAMQDLSAFAASGTGVFSVAKKSDLYRIYDRGDQFRDEAAPRAAGTEAALIAADITTASYVCQRFAAKVNVTDEDIANDTVGDPRLEAFDMLMLKLFIRREVQWVLALFDTGKWGLDRDGTSSGPTGDQFIQFNESASTPRNLFHADAIVIHEKTGQWPNQLTLQPNVLAELLLHADIVDAFKHTTAGATPDMSGLADALFSLGGIAPNPTIRVAGGTKTTSAEGVADTFAYIAGKDGLLAYVDPSPGRYKPSAYYTFSWQSELFGSNSEGVRFLDYEDVPRATPNVIEAEICVDPKLISKDHGVFYEDAVA